MTLLMQPSNPRLLLTGACARRSRASRFCLGTRGCAARPGSRSAGRYAARDVSMPSVARVAALLLLIFSCRQSAIRGLPDSQEQWTRALKGLVPPGSDPDSAISIFSKAGLACTPNPTPPGSIWCDGQIKGVITTQHWQVVFDTAGGKVANLRGTYGLIAP